MRKFDSRKTEYNKERVGGHKLPVRLSALVLVLCLSFSLLMPINALGTDTLCGKEEHSHTISCYVHAAGDYACTAGLSADHILHTHSAACYGADGALYCPLNELENHSHSEECYIPAHSHGEACVEKVKGELICTLSDTEVHTHVDACYAEKSVLTCTLAEYEAHTHAEACYGAEGQLVCTLTAGEGHAHGDSCYENQKSLVCTLSDTEAHSHVDACYKWAEKQICQLEEREEPQLKCEKTVYTLHSHDDSCYSEGKLLCTYPQVIEHNHSIACLGVSVEELKPLCKKEEHTHEAEKCYIDPNADLETATEWERTLPKKLSGIYISLLCAMVCGRVVWGCAMMVIMGINGSAFTWSAFLAGALLNAIPGIAVQLVLIPLLVKALHKAQII